MKELYSIKWRNYRNLTENVGKLRVQHNLFPNRVETAQAYEKAKDELFTYYELFTNRNNVINPIVTKIALKDWFSENCEVKSTHEVNDWFQKQDLQSNNLLVLFADNIIGGEMQNLCFCGGTRYCPQVKGDETQCAMKIIVDVMKKTDNYIHYPMTEENLDIFINGSTQYLSKEISKQEEFASPIEKIMYEALLPIASKYNLNLKFDYPLYDTGRLEIRYLLDIVFVNQSGELILNVECDGLTFHNSFENMSSDRARDRWLLIRGIPCMRFTSRDIYSDLNNSTIQVEEALKTILSKNK